MRSRFANLTANLHDVGRAAQAALARGGGSGGSGGGGDGGPANIRQLAWVECLSTARVELSVPRRIP